MSKKNQLFTAFDPVSNKQWMAKIAADLKGKPLESLDWKISDELNISPIQARSGHQTSQPIIKNGHNDWSIGASLKFGTTGKTNKELLYFLMNGVDAPCLTLSKIPTKTDFKKVLDEVGLDYISIHFDASKKIDWLKFISIFNEVVPSFCKNPKALLGSIDFDPFDKPTEAKMKMAKSLLMIKNRKSPRFKVITLDSSNSYKGDESVVKEVSMLLSKGSDCLANFSTKTNVEKVLNAIRFEFSIGLNYYLSIAKIRAFKKLWPLVLKGYRVKNIAPFIGAHLHPSTQVENHNTNMIQATTQAMSAVIGGVDHLSILPADKVSKKSTAFGNRIARNIHHLLKMESHLHFVEDPAAGSYFLEELTDQICELAWKEFQSFEKIS